MMAATIPDVLVSIATIAAMTAMIMAMPTAVNMNEPRRPSFSMVNHVPKDETRNQTCRKPDINSAR
jgi:hypothetical protein